MQKVTVYVRGGNVVETEAPEDIEVEVIDYDKMTKCDGCGELFGELELAPIEDRLLCKECLLASREAHAELYQAGREALREASATGEYPALLADMEQQAFTELQYALTARELWAWRKRWLK